MKLIGIDPASKKLGIVGIEYIDSSSNLTIYYDKVVESPSFFNETQRTQFMSHVVGAYLAIDKPDVVVSEKPFGIGFSAQYLKELIGGIKTSYWDKINWQGVSEARKTVLGEGFGGAKKDQTSDWLLQYKWNKKSRKIIEEQIKLANPDTKEGYDILDAILHVLCYLIANKHILPVTKVKGNGRKSKKT